MVKSNRCVKFGSPRSFGNEVSSFQRSQRYGQRKARIRTSHLIDTAKESQHRVEAGAFYERISPVSSFVEPSTQKRFSRYEEEYNVGWYRARRPYFREGNRGVFFISYETVVDSLWTGS